MVYQYICQIYWRALRIYNIKNTLRKEELFEQKYKFGKKNYSQPLSPPIETLPNSSFFQPENLLPIS